MNRVRIYIATTEGPVEIQRLAKEDPEVRSVVCLNGTSEALPISPGYDAFVRKPTGIIERLFNHPVYRMDVSQRISDGRSWQLGALAAHALNAQGKLAGKDDQAEQILWITGEVDSELKIHPVDHVQEKLRQSSPLFEEVNRQHKSLTLIISAANREHVIDDQLPRWSEVLAIENAADLFQMLQLETSSNGLHASSVLASANNTAPTSTTSKQSKLISMVAGGLLTAVVITLAGFALQHRASKESPHVDATGVVPVTIVADKESRHANATEVAPDKVVTEVEAPELTLYELRAPRGSNCAAVRFGKLDPVKIEITPSTSENYRSKRLDKLCGLTFRLLSLEKNARLKIGTRFIKGDRYFENSRLFALAPQIQQGPEAHWRIIFPRRFRQGFQYEITLGSNSKEFKPIFHFGD